MADDDLKPLQIRAKYHQMLKTLSEHHKRSMIRQLETMVEAEFKKIRAGVERQGK